MAGAARGQKALGALPQLVKSLRSEPVSGGARLRRLPSLRYTGFLQGRGNASCCCCSFRVPVGA